jgi:hypothetical protein
VGSYAFGYLGPAGDAAHDPPCGVTIDPFARSADEDRPFAAFTNCEVDGPRRPGREGDRHDLAAFAQNPERAVSPLQPEILDVGADGLGDPEPVEGEQADQGVIPCVGEPGGDQHGADLVAVQAGGVGLVVQAGSAHMRRRRHRDQALFFA